VFELGGTNSCGVLRARCVPSTYLYAEVHGVVRANLDKQLAYEPVSSGGGSADHVQVRCGSGCPRWWLTFYKTAKASIFISGLHQGLVRGSLAATDH
jgi:hypothetical protein